MAEASLAAASLLPDQQSLDEIHSVIETLQFESPNSEILPKAMIELANVYFQLDRLEEGRQLAHQSLEERERIFGTDSREYIRGLAILGVFLATSDGGGPIRPNLEDGYRYVREGARRARELFGTGDPTTVSNLIHYRSVLDEMGRHDEAKALDEQILPYLDNIDEGW
ncbi:MAG: tetratricopeptide repeat protein [Acidobacteriota bacterium]